MSLGKLAFHMKTQVSKQHIGQSPGSSRARWERRAAMAATLAGASEAMRTATPAGAGSASAAVLAALRAARAAAHAASGLAWMRSFGEEARLARSTEAALDAAIALRVAAGAGASRGRRHRGGKHRRALQSEVASSADEQALYDRVQEESPHAPGDSDSSRTPPFAAPVATSTVVPMELVAEKQDGHRG